MHNNETIRKELYRLIQDAKWYTLCSLCLLFMFVAIFYLSTAYTVTVLSAIACFGFSGLFGYCLGQHLSATRYLDMPDSQRTLYATQNRRGFIIATMIFSMFSLIFLTTSYLHVGLGGFTCFCLVFAGLFTSTLKVSSTIIRLSK